MIVSGRVNRGLLYLNPTPVDVELLGKQRGQRREHALTHLRLGYPQHHLSVRVNPDPGIEGCALGRLGCGRGIPVDCEQCTDSTRPGETEEPATSRIATQGVTIPLVARAVVGRHAIEATPRAGSRPMVATSTTAQIRQLILLLRRALHASAAIPAG